MLLFLTAGVSKYCNSPMGTSHTVAEHLAFTWPLLVLHPVSSGYSSDLSSCSSCPLPSTTGHEGFSYTSICSAIHAVRLWHVAAPAAMGVPPRHLVQRKVPVVCETWAQPTDLLFASTILSNLGIFQCPGQLEVAEGELFTPWGNVKWQQQGSADVICEVDGNDQRSRRKFYVCVLCISGYLHCAFWGCYLKQEPVAEAPELLLLPALGRGVGWHQALLSNTDWDGDSFTSLMSQLPGVRFIV